jgi:hypothetical protein
MKSYDVCECGAPLRLMERPTPTPRTVYCVRALKFPSAVFDKAVVECKAHKSWNTIETDSFNIVMLDEPEWLAATLVRAG